MLSIHVENETIFFNGNQEESAGTQLNGYVELYLTEPTRFKKLTLQFTGTLRLHWEEEKENKKSIVANKKVHRFKKVILQKEWQFIDNPKWRRTTTQLESHMKHRYPFQMIIPGNTSESMNAHPYGSLTYELKATAIKQLSLSSPSSNHITTCLPIHILRIQPRNELFDLINDDGEDGNTLQLSNTWEQLINYHIQLNKKIYHRGEPIQINFTFHPLTQGLKIRHLSCFLKEYTTIKLNQQQQQQDYTQNKIISLVRNNKFPCRGRNEWKHVETLIIPRSPQNSQLDLSHPYLEIEHKVKFTIHFVQMYGQSSQLHLTIPIKLYNESSLSSMTNINHNQLSTMPSQIRSLSLVDLPRYEDACLSRPYDPEHWLTTTTPPILSPPYQEMDWDQEITTPEDNLIHQQYNSCSNNQIDDYFSYQPSNNNNTYSHSMLPLHRVPSYETAIRSPF
ncbi:unnamed protein product [Cunninghamella blakesleeana]